MSPFPGRTSPRGGWITNVSFASSFKLWYIKKTVDTSVLWTCDISNIWSSSHISKTLSKMQIRNPFLHFHMLQTSLTICRNSDAHLNISKPYFENLQPCCRKPYFKTCSPKFLEPQNRHIRSTILNRLVTTKLNLQSTKQKLVWIEHWKWWNGRNENRNYESQIIGKS